MWQKLAGCFVATGMLISPAMASMDPVKAPEPDQKHTLPVVVNTRGDVERTRPRTPAEEIARRELTQKDTTVLPRYLNRKGELSLIGPSGLFEDSTRLRVDMRPDARHLVSFRMIW